MGADDLAYQNRQMRWRRLMSFLLMKKRVDRNNLTLIRAKSEKTSAGYLCL